MPPTQSATGSTAAGAAGELPTPGSPRHAAWLYTAAGLREPLAALFGAERAIGESSDGRLAHEVAHARLQWWQHETQLLARGAGVHPLSRALQAHAATAGQSPPDLQGWVTATGEQLARVAWLDREEFTAHCQRWTNSIWSGAAALLAGGTRHAMTDASRAALTAAGNALRELELLGTLASAARQGQLHLPLAELQRCRAATSDCYAQPWPVPLAELIGERLRLARHSLAAATNNVPASLWPALRGLGAWLGVADRHARRMQRALPLQWNRAESPFADAAGDTFTAWRAARRAQRGLAPLQLDSA